MSEEGNTLPHRNHMPPNRLAREVSPYLLQHQHNPVDWWAWGDAALAEAQASNRPILLSIGYAACHWCHVMAHESFENPAIAQQMNELFINIKVDREERPDLDAIYQRPSPCSASRAAGHSPCSCAQTASRSGAGPISRRRAAGAAPASAMSCA